MTAPHITITYCTQCNWLLRASWMASELLNTFGTEIGSVTLVPPGTGGVFHIDVDGTQIWERKRDGGFPPGAPPNSSGWCATPHSPPTGTSGTATRPDTPPRIDP